MDVVIRPTAEDAAELTARLIAAALRARPNLTLGLATGCTMEAVYARLAWMHQEDGLDFSQCRTFNLDEYAGLPPEHPQSYRHYMNRHLFEKVNIQPGRTHLPDGTAADLRAECARYEELIVGCGGIDLQLLGIGLNGHLGFNEPLSSFRSRTRVVTLSPATRQQNAPLFSSPADMPRRALTMGLGTILEARRCLLLATGGDKADIVAWALEGPMCARVPASALQLHADCEVILDEAAAGRLEDADHYRSLFEQEPKWAPFRKG
ncbi:MAG: glucosamine-6-phosphate deaminase [Verrucomicrobiota bacterium]|nr:glucosamine-6-phosphate deaminase [Verrucomicrobiota bacterium]